MTALVFILLVSIGYLAGSLCSAIIVSQVCSLPDPRTEGSKNPGATNVLRLAGKKYALIVMVFDVLKGVLPVLLAKALGASEITVSFTCLAAILGHMFPVFFQFQGGKGVATALGALSAFQPILGLAIVATWLIVAKIFHYSSLASMVSMTLAPFFAFLIIGNPAVLPAMLIISGLILYKHRENLSRLMKGNESKINFKKSI